MHQVVPFGERQVFTTENARFLSRVVYRFTQRYAKKVDQLIEKIESQKNLTDEQILHLEEEINSLISEWQKKVEKLGAIPKGLWLVDFDAGDGYFCWKYPEAEVSHWHRYNDGFTKRVHLSKRRVTLPFQERIKKRIFEITRST